MLKLILSGPDCSRPQFRRRRGFALTISHPLYRRCDSVALLHLQVEIVKSQIALRNGITMYVNIEASVIYSGGGNVGIHTADAKCDRERVTFCLRRREFGNLPSDNSTL
jgi:hypothetical protein